MKSGTLSKLAVLVLVVISTQCQAQPGPEKMPAPPPPPPGQERHQLEQVTSFKGKSGELTMNDDYVYDGFYLQSADTKYRVKFPAHMGSQLTKALRTGNSVTVNGVQLSTPENDKAIRLISIVVNGQTITDTASPMPPAPSLEQQVTGTGKITALQKNRLGEVNGYMVDGKTILRVPPHISNQMNSLVATGASVSYSGMKRSLHSGEISGADYTVVQCQSITVNGTQYLTR